LQLETVERQTGDSPRYSIIWLHGLGADGHDFEPIVDEFDFDRLPAIRFIFPHAPMRAVTINGGYVMRAWYDIVSIDFKPGREEEEGVRLSAKQIEALIERENSRGIADSHILLTGLRHPRRLAGILALSCYMALTDTLASESSAANREVPIFMAHGRHDAVIPYDFGKRSAKLLQAQGYALKWHAYETEHSVCYEEVRDIEAWLQEVLVAAG
jgi:phospholipase/carboxylesterase